MISLSGECRVMAAKERADLRVAVLLLKMDAACASTSSHSFKLGYGTGLLQKQVSGFQRQALAMQVSSWRSAVSFRTVAASWLLNVACGIRSQQYSQLRWIEQVTRMFAGLNEHIRFVRCVPDTATTRSQARKGG